VEFPGSSRGVIQLERVRRRWLLPKVAIEQGACCTQVPLLLYHRDGSDTTKTAFCTSTASCNSSPMPPNKLFGDQFVIPAQNGIGFGEARHLLQP
jgi:hypothetical protein